MSADAAESRVHGVSHLPAERPDGGDQKTMGAPGTRVQGRRPPRRLGQIPGGRHGLAPEAVAESQRRRILTAMRTAVVDGGYEAATIAAVIARAGVSRKTFYEQFAGKDECFAVAYGDEMDRLLDITLGAFEDEGPWVARLRAALTALCAVLAGNPQSARLCFVEAPSAGAATAERRRAALRGLLPLFDAAPSDALGDVPFRQSLSLGRIGDLAEMLRQEIASDNARGLPRMVPQLTYVMAVPFLGPDRAAQELAADRRLRPAS